MTVSGREGGEEPAKPKSLVAAIPTLISVLAFVFSGFSYYESAMKQAELSVFVPPVIHYGRDGGGDVELFAIPVTITNSGARTGTVLSMDLTVERVGEGDKDTPRTKRYYGAYLGEHPRSSDVINRAFAPASLASRQSWSDTVRFYPVGNPLPKIVQDKGEFRFTLRLALAEPAGQGWWDRLWAGRVEPVVFTLTMPFLSEQFLNFRRGSIAMHAKDHRPMGAGGAN